MAYKDLVSHKLSRGAFHLTDAANVSVLNPLGLNNIAVLVLGVCCNMPLVSLVFKF